MKARSMSQSLLPPRVDLQLRSLERSWRPDRDPITARCETVEAIWTIVEGTVSDRSLDASHEGGSALLARRELVRRGTCALSAVIRRGIASGTFRPRCTAWAIRRLPFAIVAGGCVHWVFGLTPGPSLRAATAVAAVLEALRPKPRNTDEGRVVGKANRSADSGWRPGAGVGRSLTESDPWQP